MNKSIASLLKENGPCLTSDLIKSLVENGVNEAAARQRIIRASSEYKRLAGIRLEKNARFIYLEEHYGSALFWENLEKAFSKGGKSYWAAISTLKARGGRCPKYMFPAISGAPIHRKKQLSPDNILDRLISIQLLKETSDSESGENFIEFNPHSYSVVPLERTKADLIAEYVALHGIRDYARKVGFGSYNKFNMRGDEAPPTVSGVQWDISAPSYMRPLVSVNNGNKKPGFFVCDLNLHKPIDVDQVVAFIRKHDMASAPKAVAPIMPFIVGDVFLEDAYSVARQSGIVAVTISQMFGEEIAKSLRELIKLLTDTGATVSVNPDHLYIVMNGLTKIEGAANRLRGALFELAVGILVKDVEGGYLHTGFKRTDYETGQKTEIDVLLDRDKEDILVIECKSKIPGLKVTKDVVKEWFSTKVPIRKKILLQEKRYKDRKFRFELWSNGLFENDALEWFNNQKLQYDTHSMAIRDGKAMKVYAQNSHNPSVRNILREHYFKHPLN